MPNFLDSVLSKAQSKLNARYAQPEMRDKMDGALAVFQRDTDFTIPNANALRLREDRAVETAFLTRVRRNAAGFNRTHNHTGTVNDSAKVDITWSTFGDLQVTSLKRSDGNIFNQAEVLANAVDNALKNIRESVSAAGLAYLDTNKTQVNAATQLGNFNAPNNVFEIAAGNADLFFDYGSEMMMQNYYNGSYNVLANSTLAAKARFLGNQGSGNQTNSGYQLNNLTVNTAIGLTDANYANGISYFIAPGSIGMLDWIPVQNRQGEGDYSTFVGGFGTIVDPLTGLNIAIHGYSQRADNSASNSVAQDVNTEWEFSVDVGFVKAPINENANESTIFAVGQI